MNAERLGEDLRLVRIRLGWRQSDVAARSACSQSEVSRIERGMVATVPLGRVDAVARALGARFVPTLLWHGERLDRLRDERHADLVDRVARRLEAAEWAVAPEVSFSVWGERGSIDLLAFHRAARMLLVVEVKTAFGDVQQTISTIDRKQRLAPRVATERGWNARSVSVLLVVADTTTNRRLVARLATTFRSAFAVVGRAASRRLRTPGVEPFRGLLFLPPSPSTTRKRVRRARPGDSGPSPGRSPHAVDSAGAKGPAPCRSRVARRIPDGTLDPSTG